MNVLLLTVFVGLIFACLFIVLFLYQLVDRRYSSSERESLLPLENDDGVTSNNRSSRK
ncbi:MAG: hypothetical protein JJT75_06340 [Opitutales bacterium]|nr:hypothetical protein [Opitutales bacterium]MCH8541275.1 hypothetical protein [Opitutales bacterium]